MENSHYPGVKPKRRNRTILLICGLVLLGIGVILFGDREQQPTFQGRSLSSWLSAYDRGAVHDTDLEAAQNAVRQMGTNALPCLLKWIQYERPAWRSSLSRVTRTRAANNPTLQRWVEGPAFRRSEYALIGFNILTTNAIVVLPELERLTKNTAAPDTARNAFYAISSIGKPALPLIERALQDTNQSNHDLSIYVPLSRMGMADGPAEYLPVLQQALTNDDAAVRRAATSTLHLWAKEGRK